MRSVATPVSERRGPAGRQQDVTTLEGAVVSCSRPPRRLPRVPTSSDDTPTEPAWQGPRLIALRGATSVPANERDAILERTTELLEAIMERNGLGPDDFVSAIFTCTPDLTAEFPAVAARQLGFDQVPLLCAQEIDKPGALALAVRVMFHAYVPAGHESRHVYLHEARALRADLDAAQ